MQNKKNGSYTFMKLVREYIINEKFSEESDPVEDLGIGVKASIAHSIKLFIKLNKKRRKINIKGFLYHSGINDKTSFLIEIQSKTKNVDMIPYFNDLIHESGLDKFIDINDSLINDEFRESQFTFTNRIQWEIKDKYKKYFNEISNDKIS
jgi:hypothetical protein